MECMESVLADLPDFSDGNLLVGPKTFDDAGVFQINDQLALVQTLDFFTPIVDDPYDYGQIAAANALSDVYAMGGTPLTAMNILTFPTREVDHSTIAQILKGGADKVHEAGAVIVGGHTLQDSEIKYGLSVTGLIHPKRVVRNSSARPGDALILTKPLGGGLIISALKAGEATEEEVAGMVALMKTLNKAASEAMVEVGANACTDITGFGFLGHAYEMALMSKVTLAFSVRKILLLPGSLRHADMGLMPGASVLNKGHLLDKVKVEGDISDNLLDVLFDAQTSGGLLIALPRKKADSLLEKLDEKGVKDAAIVGEALEMETFPLKVRP